MICQVMSSLNVNATATVAFRPTHPSRSLRSENGSFDDS